MPTYTYQCRECGHTIDLFHNITAKPRVKCPKCQSKCTRLFGCGSGIIFKGSGFYQTDYKNGGNAAASSKKTEPKSEAKSESSGGSKTAAAAE